MFEQVRSDWRTHNYDWSRHGFWALLVYRFGRWRYTIKNRVVRKPFSFLYKFLKMMADSFCGIELPCEVVIGERFVIEHIGGIVISAAGADPHWRRCRDWSECGGAVRCSGGMYCRGRAGARDPAQPR